MVAATFATPEFVLRTCVQCKILAPSEVKRSVDAQELRQTQTWGSIRRAGRPLVHLMQGIAHRLRQEQGIDRFTPATGNGAPTRPAGRAETGPGRSGAGPKRGRAEAGPGRSGAGPKRGRAETGPGRNGAELDRAARGPRPAARPTASGTARAEFTPGSPSACGCGTGGGACAGPWLRSGGSARG